MVTTEMGEVWSLQNQGRRCLQETYCFQTPRLESYIKGQPTSKINMVIVFDNTEKAMWPLASSIICDPICDGVEQHGICQ